MPDAWTLIVLITLNHGFRSKQAMWALFLPFSNDVSKRSAWNPFVTLETTQIINLIILVIFLLALQMVPVLCMS